MLKKYSIDGFEIKLKKYLNSENISKPLLVNVNNQKDYQDIISVLNQYMSIRKVSDYCHAEDIEPNMEEVNNDLVELSENVYLIGLCQYLKLCGDVELERGISTLLGTAVPNKVVVVCYQIENYLETICQQDLRLERQLVLIEGDRSAAPQLIFVADNLGISTGGVIGFKEAFKCLEKNDIDKILVITKKHKEDFPKSMINIKEVISIYDVFVLYNYNFVSLLSEENGTAEEWSFLLEKLNQEKSFDRVLEKTLGNNTLFEFIFAQWNNFNDLEKWLFFIGIKVNGAKNSNTLQKAADKAHNLNEFYANIYRGLLDYETDAEDYWHVYKERKNLLMSISVDAGRVVDYCNFTEIKGKKAIYYLTDNTEVERIKIVECLSKYDYKRKEIIEVLNRVYPDLAAYLNEYHFGISLLDEYFQDYKFQKVTNRVYPEFLDKVRKNAESREYLAKLPYRSEIMDTINKENTLLYFVDALGVEFLGYIMEKCKDLGLSAQVAVCHCNLPSITSLNKEFLQEFDVTRVVSIKELDEILHHGKEDFDYRKQKYPIHLTRELEIISEFLEKASCKILSGECSKAIVVSDHGASRLAVINNETYDFDVDSKGTHGGRCCAYEESLPNISYAIQEGDYYVLASYDRFKGGRAASVETHGGATLEEVVVPIIELQKKVDIEVILSPLTIKVSMRKKAEIEVFTNVIVSEISVCVNGKFYSGIKIDEHKFKVEMPDIRRAGVYAVDVYSNNNIIAKGIDILVEKEGFSEKDFF